MKQLHHSQEVTVDRGVTVAVKARVVTVTGPRGTLTKNFKHLKVCFSILYQILRHFEGWDEIYWRTINFGWKVDGLIQGQGCRPNRVLTYF